MSEKFILSVDQGTGSTKCILVDKRGRLIAKGAAGLGESYPAPGWVDQDPEEIWRSVGIAAKACLDGRDPSCIEAVAFSTQRESMLLWDRKTGAPISKLVSWQDRRSTGECDKLRAAGHADVVRERSGLPLDPMFSALKAKWLLDEYDPDRRRTKNGELCLGTVESFFLTRFARGDHLTEAGNASRTQLLNVRRAEWDPELLDLFNVQREALPRVCKSNGPFPAVRGVDGIPDGTPVLAVLGDSHAALFGHGAFKAGQLKATYGTGSSVMGILGNADRLHPGICLTIGWDIGAPALAAEANIRSSGATIRWVAALLGIEPADVARLADELAASGHEGAVLIPGFGGLGAPWWDNGATALVDGLTLDSDRRSLALGAIESVPHQIADIVEILADGGLKPEALFADGGMTKNKSIMQLQADLTGIPVASSQDAELSAMGAAHLAGLGAGWWDMEGLAALERPKEYYSPVMDAAGRGKRRARWKKALAKARTSSGGAV